MIDQETGSTFGDKASGDYVPMQPAHPVGSDGEPAVESGSPLDAREAAEEVVRRRASGESARQQEETEREASPVDTVRQYNESSGPRAGQRMPSNQTVSPEQASADLTAARQSEAAAKQAAEDIELARQIDALRAEQQP